MSAFGSKADMALCGNSLSRSLLGVKRKSLFAAQMSAFDPKRTLLSLPISQFNQLRWLPRSRDNHETTRVHHTSWRYGSGMAARGTRARPTGKTHRHTHSLGRGGKQNPHRSVVAGAAATGLGRRPQHPD